MTTNMSAGRLVIGHGVSIVTGEVSSRAFAGHDNILTEPERGHSGVVSCTISAHSLHSFSRKSIRHIMRGTIVFC